MKRAAIVGAGIGGLTSALLLNRQGWDVTVYERGSRVGGRIALNRKASTGLIRGPTIVLLPEMLLGILEEAGVDRSKVELLRCDPLYRVHYHSGRVMTKKTDRQEQTEEIERLFPGEGRGFNRFMKDMDTLFPAGRAAFLEQMFPRKGTSSPLRSCRLWASCVHTRVCGRPLGIILNTKSCWMRIRCKACISAGLPLAHRAFILCCPTPSTNMASGW